MGIFKSTVRFRMIYTLFWLLLLSSTASYGGLGDVYCLKALKDSLEDPLQKLSSWNFKDNVTVTDGFICRFAGVSCWHVDNKVTEVHLRRMGLKGEFPIGLKNCSFMTELNLSGNQLSGPIPYDICESIPYLTFLDLSSNNFSGEIPLSLSNCRFLNYLVLDNNRFSGQIPPQIGSLDRLKTFSVTNNLLSGKIPTFVSDSISSASSYANNPGLCGKPLDVICKGKTEPTSTDREILILGLVVYFVVTVLSSWCWYWLLFAKIKTKRTPTNQTTRHRASRETRLPSVLPS